MSTSPEPTPASHLLKPGTLAEQEVLLEETRGTAWYFFPGPIASLVLVAILGILFVVANPPYAVGGYSAHTIGLYAILFLVAIGLIWLAARYVLWYATVYAVSNRRVFLQRGILSRDLDEIPLEQVRGVEVHQSIGQRILGYGSVRVSSESGRTLGNEDWEGVPHPFRFQKLIESATVARESQPRPVFLVPPPGAPNPARP